MDRLDERMQLSETGGLCCLGGITFGEIKMRVTWRVTCQLYNEEAEAAD